LSPICQAAPPEVPKTKPNYSSLPSYLSKPFLILNNPDTIKTTTMNLLILTLLLAAIVTALPLPLLSISLNVAPKLNQETSSPVPNTRFTDPPHQEIIKSIKSIDVDRQTFYVDVTVSVREEEKEVAKGWEEFGEEEGGMYLHSPAEGLC